MHFLVSNDYREAHLFRVLHDVERDDFPFGLNAEGHGIVHAQSHLLHGDQVTDFAEADLTTLLLVLETVDSVQKAFRNLVLLVFTEHLCHFTQELVVSQLVVLSEGVAHDHVDVGRLFAEALVRISGEFVRAKRQVRIANILVVSKDLASILAHFDLIIIVLVVTISAGRPDLVRFGMFQTFTRCKALFFDQLLLAETGRVKPDLVPPVTLLVLASAALPDVGRNLVRCGARIMRLRGGILLLIVEWVFVVKS